MGYRAETAGGALILATIRLFAGKDGDRAYFEALARARYEDENGGDPSHWFAVRREIAKRTGKEIGLDTATRYVGP